MKSLLFIASICALAGGCDKPRQEPSSRVTFSETASPATAVPHAPIPAPVAPSVPPQPTPETLPPVAPGQYVNHVGNPAAGHWGPDGQWVWKNPESPEANDTWKFLAAAGAGAAGGAAITYMLSKKHFEQRHGEGATWTRTANVHDEHTYRDKRGAPISAVEYERRKAQSERDKAAHRARQEAARGTRNDGSLSTTYRDKRGNVISKEEHERRKAQSERDKARSQSRRSSSRRRR